MIKKIIFLLLLTNASLASIPIMDITFGGALGNSCEFVDDAEVIGGLYSTLEVLNNIEERRDECQSLLLNSRTYIRSFIDYTAIKNEELSTAKSNQKILLDTVTQMQTNGTYTGQHDGDLLNLARDIARLDNNELVDNELLTNTLGLGETIFSELEANPTCRSSFGTHILAPSVAMMGSIASIATSSINPIYGAVSSFLSTAISYFGRVTENSYQARRDLTEDANYHLSYKCAFKNIDDLICKIQEDEDFSSPISLDNLEKKILKLDESGDFKDVRDLQRHRYRITNIIDKLEKIFNSPETFNDLEQIVTYQTRIANLSTIAKLPPLKNIHYLQATGVSPLPSDVWQGWNHNEVSWAMRFRRRFGSRGSTDYLSSRVNAYCKQIGQLAPEISFIYSNQMGECQAYILQKEGQIDLFIKVIITPSLVDLQNEINRIYDKIKQNPNVQNLFSVIKAQQINFGTPDYREYSLTKLLDKIISHTDKNSDGAAEPFAKEFKKIAINIEKLATATMSRRNTFGDDSFKNVALEVYNTIAKISNEGKDGGILYKSIIESKISSYFDEIQSFYLNHSNRKLAEKYVMFNHLADLHRQYSLKLIDSDVSGSDNFSLMSKVQHNYIKVFGKVISKKFIESIKTYKKNKRNLREMIHSCSLFLPYFKNKMLKSKARKNSRFCERLLKNNKGISFLKGDNLKYPLQPNNAPNYQSKCYYYNYNREVTARKIYLYNQRVRRIRF